MKFDKLLEKYVRLLEADPMGADPTGGMPPAADAGMDPTGGGMPPMDPMAGGQPPAPPPQMEPASPGFVLVTQIILEALKAPEQKFDLKFSNNTPTTTKEAWKYLEKVVEHVSPDLQYKFQQKINGPDKADLEMSNIITMAKAAIDALYFVKIASDLNAVTVAGLPFNQITTNDITSENAKQAFDNLVGILSTARKSATSVS